MDNFNVEIKEPEAVEMEIQGLAESPGGKVQSNYTENNPSAPSFILNRPFYDNSTTEPLEVTFDGDLTGKTVVSFGELLLVKLSDAVPTLDEIRAGEITIHILENGQIHEENVPVSELDLMDGSSNGVPAYFATWENVPIGALAYEDFVFEGVAVTKGIYGVYVTEGSATAYVGRLYIPSVTYEDIKKLDNKFIDAEWTAYVQPAEKNIFEEQEVTESQIYTLNSPFPAYPITANVTYNGANYSCGVFSESGVSLFGNRSIIGGSPDTGEPFLCLCVENEIVFAIGDSATMSVSIVYENFAKIPDKFLPDHGKITVEWGSESHGEFFQKLLQPWLAGATVIVTGVPDISEMRLLYLDAGDILGELWSAVFVTNGGSLFLTSNIIYENADLNGIAKLVSFGYDSHVNVGDAIDTDGQVLVGKDGGFSPVELNGTLTKGSTLPAQEGAVYTAINGLETKFNNFQTIVTQANEILESTLNGGA
jgi:hypothetical protein